MMSRYIVISWLIFVGATAGACWTEQNFLGMINDAQHLLPNNLQNLINRYSAEFYRECVSSCASIDAREQLVESILKDSNDAITSFTTGRSFASGTRLLGRIGASIAHIHALLTDTSKLKNKNWQTDYAIFLQKNRQFLRIRWQGMDRRPKSRDELKVLLTKSVANHQKVSKILEDNLNRENKSISEYDTLSAPFGAGSIAYSSAVSSMAMTWLYIWDQAGGM